MVFTTGEHDPLQGIMEVCRSITIGVNPLCEVLTKRGRAAALSGSPREPSRDLPSGSRPA